MSFATLRSIAPLPLGTEWAVLQSRLNEILAAGVDLIYIGPEIERSVALLRATAANFDRRVESLSTQIHDVE